jgi:hypothetical protein
MEIFVIEILAFIPLSFAKQGVKQSKRVTEK